MGKKVREGRRLKTLSPMAQVAPFIMQSRTGAQNMIRQKICIDRINEYVREKKAAGYSNFNFMHVIVACYLRVLAQRPGLNRFIRGQRIYARNGVEVMMTIKKEMTLDSPDTCIKMDFEPGVTALDVYDAFEKTITEYRKQPGGDFDSFAKILTYLPSLIMKFFIWLIKLVDYFGGLPRRLTKLSPFHGSLFLTSMGSLGIPVIYHHLYEFGNVPLFIAFGKRYKDTKPQSEGTEKSSYIDFTVVMDERICDGFYFASALKLMQNILKNPWQLDQPAETVIPDID